MEKVFKPRALDHRNHDDSTIWTAVFKRSSYIAYAFTDKLYCKLIRT